MLISVEASNLHESSVLTQTHTEHLFRNDACIKHGIVNWLLTADTHASSHAEAKNAISCLIVKQLGFFGDTSKWELKTIVCDIVLVAEVNLVSHHESFITGPLHIPLIKLALIPIRARATSVCLAIINVSRLAFVEFVPLIDMTATRVSRSLPPAVVLAWDCSHGRPSVHDQRLSLLVGAKVHICVEILQVRRVTIQLRWLNV